MNRYKLEEMFIVLYCILNTRDFTIRIIDWPFHSPGELESEAVIILRSSHPKNLRLL